MTKTELQKATDQIRGFLKESELDKATELLLEVAKKINYDAYEEALIISATWNQLERDSRSALIREQEEKVQRNQLIEQIMEFTRDLEGMRKKPKVAPANPTVTTKKASNAKYFLMVASVIILGVLFFFWPKKADNEGMTPSNSNKNITIENEAKSQQKDVKELDAKSDQKTNNQDNGASYKKQLKLGQAAYKNQRYEKALMHFQQAQKANNSSSVQTKIIETTEKCYRKYFSKGMDYWNDGDYNFAKIAFEKAQSYKDISQVQAMIKKCQEKIE